MQLAFLRHWLLHGPPQKLKLIKSLTVRLEIPGYDFVKASQDLPVPDPAAGTQPSLIADASHPAISTFAGVSFGGRPLEAVVRFLVNGAKDDMPYREMIRMPRAEFRKYASSKFMMLLAAYGGSCIHDALGESRTLDGFFELERKLQEGMGARL